MLSRRLLLGGGAAVLCLPACGLVPPDGAPPIAPAPDARVPGHAAVTALRAALVDAQGAGLAGAQADLLAWALDVNDDQHAAVSLTVPATPRPTAATVASAAPSPTAPLPTLAAALADARGAFTRQALDAATARPLVWASMAAWCAAVSAQLPDAEGAREPARGVRLPAPQEPDAAAQAALDAAAAALYGLQVAAGAPGLAPAQSAAFSARLDFWAGLRDDLDAGLRKASASPTPPPPWYTIAPPADPASASALAARVQTAALPVLGRTVAHGPPALRALLARAVADVAVDVPRWGGLVERWPGLPAT